MIRGRGGRAEGAGAEGRKPTASAENPSMKEKLKEAQERQRLENENRQLKVQVEYLEEDLSWERGISARLREGIGAVLDFLDPAPRRSPPPPKGRGAPPPARGAQPEREKKKGPPRGGGGGDEACPGALQEPPGQAIITVKIGNKMY